MYISEDCKLDQMLKKGHIFVCWEEESGWRGRDRKNMEEVLLCWFSKLFYEYNPQILMWFTMNSWMPSRKIWRKMKLLQHREERTHGPRCGVTAASHRPTNTESTGQTHTVTGPPLRVTARSEDQFRWDVKEEIRPPSSYVFPFSPYQKCLAMSIHTPPLPIKQAATKLYHVLSPKVPREQSHLWSDGHSTKERS